MSNKIFMKNFVAALSFQILMAGSLISSVKEGQQPKIGEAAPLFELESLQGDTITLANLQGKFVVIHFAASW